MAENPEMYELKKKLKLLKSYRGSGTELISLYISKGYPLSEVMNKLRQEQSQASNIKSKTTRKNVTDALTKIIQYLKIFKKTPDNGIAVFCGNVAQQPGKQDIKLFSIVPPLPIDVQLYRCDSTFFLEPLERMVSAKDVYGVLVMDGREATLAYVKGTHIQILKKIHSLAHSKIRAGGQSARRFERLIDQSIEEYYKRVGEAVDQYFIEGVKGVIVGGPGPAKEDFLKLKPFNYQVKILGVVNTGYTDEYGVREVLAKAEELLKEQELVKEKKLVDRFIKEVVTGGLATYGEKEVRESIVNHQAETVLLSEGLRLKRVKLVCDVCGREEYITVRENEGPVSKKCSCGGTLRETERTDLIDDLVDLATLNNIDVEIISTETPEGMQFLRSFYGIGAFLRYR
ncbi:peptide chain release factor aRF-1 [Candidatus Micrarchaeota archaeon]|nr:peptide chain release factor aRF-1 [Candidatus Micrarchaeota archaeon]